MTAMVSILTYFSRSGGRSITAAVTPPVCQALTVHYFGRLDDGLAFATSGMGKGEETCHQYLLVWVGKPYG